MLFAEANFRASKSLERRITWDLRSGLSAVLLRKWKKDKHEWGGRMGFESTRWVTWGVM